MTEVAGAYDGCAWITEIVRTGCGIILKKSASQELSVQNWTGAYDG